MAAYGDRVPTVLAIRITGNSSDAEEVEQDALWAAIRKIDTFRGTAAFGSWVYRITANAAYQKRRGRRIERNAMSWDDLGPAFDETGHHVRGGHRLVAETARTPRSRPSCTPCSARPSTSCRRSYRATFVLHDVEGLSNREIAETLQIKLATVKSRVHRARLFLRSRLAAYVGDSAEVTT